MVSIGTPEIRRFHRRTAARGHRRRREDHEAGREAGRNQSGVRGAPAGVHPRRAGGSVDQSPALPDAEGTQHAGVASSIETRSIAYVRRWKPPIRPRTSGSGRASWRTSSGSHLRPDVGRPPKCCRSNCGTSTGKGRACAWTRTRPRTVKGVRSRSRPTSRRSLRPSLQSRRHDLPVRVSSERRTDWLLPRRVAERLQDRRLSGSVGA